MKHFWILVLAVSLGLNAGLAYTCLSQPRGGPDARPGADRPPPPDMANVLENHLRRMTDSLKLDDEQQASILALHERLLPLILDRHEALDRLRREVAEMYGAKELDPTAYRHRVQQLGETQAELDALVTDAMLGEADVLTPQQRRTYAQEMPWSRRGAPAPRGRPPGPPPPGR